MNIKVNKIIEKRSITKFDPSQHKIKCIGRLDLQPSVCLSPKFLTYAI